MKEMAVFRGERQSEALKAATLGFRPLYFTPTSTSGERERTVENEPL
jgi:hypothetical protein